jgi:hypothetical protein
MTLRDYIRGGSLAPTRWAPPERNCRSRARCRRTFATDWRASASLVPGENSKTSDASKGFLIRTIGLVDSAGWRGVAAAGPERLMAAVVTARPTTARCAALPSASTAAVMPRMPATRASGHLSIRGVPRAIELTSVTAGSAQVNIASPRGAGALFSSGGRDNVRRSCGLNSNSMVSSPGSSGNPPGPASNAFIIAAHCVRVDAIASNS